jgi:drug/metabolite transporter (DMT)-like permease
MTGQRRWPGVYLALGAALLFGFSTPLAKPLLGAASPWLMAGLLYLGAGLGAGTLWLIQRWTHAAPVETPLGRKDVPWLAGAVAAGGLLAPVLLMTGLRETPAATASLLLNLEGVFTLLLAWLVFRENVDVRIGVGAAAVVLGAGTLSWQGLGEFPAGAAWIGGACLLWAVDNSLSRQVSGADPLQITGIKGWVAGGVNTGLALWQGAHLPPALPLLATLGVGALGYGVSLALYVAALRHLGSARTAAYFSLAPFCGATLGVWMLGDPVTVQLLAAGGLMAVGLYLHLAERHEHPHEHVPLRHEHAHRHDVHHRHVHRPEDPPGEAHSHEHVHPPIVHRHPHYPDIHHRHGH